MPYLPYFWGVWKFSQNKTAAKELIEFLMRARAGARSAASPSRLRPAALRQHAGLQGLGGRRAAEGHALQLPDAAMAQGACLHIAASPAPPEIAVQIYNRGTMPTMMAKLLSGQSITRRHRLGARTSWKASFAG